MPLVERPEPRRLAYDVVDVFTSTPFGGNQLAVVHGAEGLTTEQLQTLAREFNFSETAFPLEPSEAERAAGATYALRIFTPSTELPYAGHPSVGTAWLLREQGHVRAGTVVQACGAGLLPLELATDGGPVRLTGGQPEWGPPIDPAAALAAVGLTAAALDPVAPPRNCSVGLPYVVLPVRPEALAECAPDLRLLEGFALPASDSSGIYVVAWDPATRSARARMFAGDIGVAEDAATGSAAGAFAVWLAVSGLAPRAESSFEVDPRRRDGPTVGPACHSDGRPGRPTRTTVAGQAVHVASGVIRRPPRWRVARGHIGLSRGSCEADDGKQRERGSPWTMARQRTSLSRAEVGRPAVGPAHRPHAARARRRGRDVRDGDRVGAVLAGQRPDQRHGGCVEGQRCLRWTRPSPRG